MSCRPLAVAWSKVMGRRLGSWPSRSSFSSRPSVARPRTGQGWNLVQALGELAFVDDRLKRLLVVEFEGGVHEALDVGGGDLQLVHGGVQVAAEPGHLGRHVGVGGDPARSPPALLFRGSRRVLHVVVVDLAEHPLLHRIGEDRVDRAEVLFHPGDFGRDPGQELQVGLVGVSARLPALADEVPDLRSLRLAVPVDAADPLLKLVRVERDVVVDQPVAVLVQVDALAGRVGGQQDADLVLVAGSPGTPA